MRYGIGHFKDGSTVPTNGMPVLAIVSNMGFFFSQEGVELPPTLMMIKKIDGYWYTAGIEDENIEISGRYLLAGEVEILQWAEVYKLED